MTDIVSGDAGLYPAKAKVWTKSLVEIIRSLWPTKTATEMVAILSTEHNISITRNSIIGKLRRLKLSIDDKSVFHASCTIRPGHRREAKPAAADPKPAAARRPHVEAKAVVRGRSRIAPEPFIVTVVDASPKHIGLFQLTDLTCRWPYGSEASVMTFCGDSVLGEKPYCAAHCRAAYRPPSDRRATP